MVEDMSEAPVLTPLTPLGDFIQKLGKAPDKEVLTTYLARLREHVSPLENWPGYLETVCHHCTLLG